MTMQDPQTPNALIPRRYITTADNEVFKPGKYPIEHFPELLREVVTEIVLRRGVKPQLAAGTLLAACATVLQAATKVQGPNSQTVGLNLSVLTIAIRAAGKNVVSDLLFSPIREYQREQNEVYEKALRKHKVKSRIHQKFFKMVDRRIDERIQQGKDFSADEQELEDLEEAAPPPPKAENVLIEDATLAAIIEVLSKGIPVATIHMPEAERFLSGKSKSDYATLNDLYDPSAHMTVLRKGQKMDIEEPVVSQNFMIQHDAMKKYIQRSREMGNIGRSCVCEISEIPETVAESSAPFKALPLFQAKLDDFLRSTMKKRHDDNFKFDVIVTSPSADEMFIEYFAKLRESIKPGGRFSDVDDAVAKLRANALKIAGIFHLMEGKNGFIEGETMKAALHVCSWYLLEFQRLFGRIGELTDEQTYARMLEEWLWARFKVKKAMFYVQVGEVRDMGPGCFRPPRRENLDLAIRALEKKGVVEVQDIRGEMQLRINREYFLTNPVPDNVLSLMKDFAYLDSPNGRYGLGSRSYQPPPRIGGG